jgi:nitrite reductase/ring-hydroxylating ferredoxin subunit/uncharacterized membrane protein
MRSEATLEAIERQDWLKPVESRVQSAVTAAYNYAGPAGRRIRNFLHGVWLGHALHPALTDIPLGAWTATAVLDLMEAGGASDCARGADTTLAVGLAGAVAAAAAGVTDWQAVDGRARRVGLSHGLLNLTVTSLYAASLIARRRRDRARGRNLAFLGLALSALSAWLGGEMVYRLGIGVNHATREPLPQDWTSVLDASELGEGEPHRGEAGGVGIVLVRRGTEVYALGEVCSHLGGPLADGDVRGDSVQCPWHGSRFSLRDGSVIDGPATHPVPCFETRIRDGRVELRARSEE